MTVTIAEAAAALAERLDIPLPEGESSPEFRLSFARTLRIEHLKNVLLHKVADGVLRIRVSDGGYLIAGAEATESSQVDIAEAQAALESNGEHFVENTDFSAPSGIPEKASRGIKFHKLKTRRNALDAVIEQATKMATAPDDYHSVWASLVSLAERKDRPAPLLGYVDDDGVKYQGSRKVDFFNKDALRKRMAR